MYGLNQGQISALKLLGFALDPRAYGAVLHKDHWAYLSYFAMTDNWDVASGIPPQNKHILDQAIAIIGPENVEQYRPE
jgi:hypothetical protein